MKQGEKQKCDNVFLKYGLEPVTRTFYLKSPPVIKCLFLLNIKSNDYNMLMVKTEKFNILHHAHALCEKIK